LPFYSPPSGLFGPVKPDKDAADIYAALRRISQQAIIRQAKSAKLLICPRHVLKPNMSNFTLPAGKKTP
jgi:hypothetical protein